MDNFKLMSERAAETFMLSIRNILSYSGLNEAYLESIIHSLLTSRRFTSSYVKGRGGRVPPRLLSGKFLLTYREKRGKQKKVRGVKSGENWEENKENCQREGEKLKMKFKVEKLQNEERTFFFFFSFLSFFSLFKTHKICFRSANQETWLCPFRKIFLLRPCSQAPLDLGSNLAYVVGPTVVNHQQRYGKRYQKHAWYWQQGAYINQTIEDQWLNPAARNIS